MSLAEQLLDAAAYAAAKAEAVGQAWVDKENIDTLSRAIVVAVLVELADREEILQELAPQVERMTSREECAVRVMDYRGAAEELRAEIAGGGDSRG